MKIEYVDYGLANNFGDTIELNKNLIRYPKLHESLLQHELSHTDKAFTLHDLKIDFISDNVNSLRIILFMIRYPKSLTQLFPFYYSKKKGFVYDINLSLLYLLMFIIIGGSITLGVML